MLPKLLDLFATDGKRNTISTGTIVNKSKKMLPNFSTCVKFGVVSACGSALFRCQSGSGSGSASKWKVDPDPIHNTDKKANKIKRNEKHRVHHPAIIRSLDSAMNSKSTGTQEQYVW
jgi:hypothetical protein